MTQKDEERVKAFTMALESKYPEYYASRRARLELQIPVLKALHGGLWHTTHPDRFKMILESGAILPEPNIKEKERWKTSQGKDYWPYPRFIGCISLFDFHQFDVSNYSDKYRCSDWHTFIPYREDWKGSVWIEIDRELVTPPQFIPGHALLARWKLEGAYRHTIMPGIEAANEGPIPVTAFKRAFLVREGDSQLQELPISARS